VLSSDRIQAHFDAGRGWLSEAGVTETTSTRVKRFLGYAGLTSSDWDVDDSTVDVNTYPQAGTSVLTGCQDMATTEGAGSVFYILNGKATFRSRDFRKPGDPALTIDAEADADSSTYQPSTDVGVLVNQQEVDRSSESGTQNALIASDSDSIDTFGLYTPGAVISYTLTDDDATYLAEDIVAAGRTPSLRIGQLALDLTTAGTDLYADATAVEIGSRLRITNLPPNASPATQADLYVEGWTLTITNSQTQYVFDCSPADNPPHGLWSSGTAAVGDLRWQCDGQTLNANITSTSSSLKVTTTGTGKPTFTTTSGAYPMKIRVDGEVITLGAAPGGSSSPQTFSTITRGVDGTTAAAHTAGATINLYPAQTWAL
jgi:hypothetical protein